MSSWIRSLRYLLLGVSLIFSLQPGKAHAQWWERVRLGVIGGLSQTGFLGSLPNLETSFLTFPIGMIGPSMGLDIGNGLSARWSLHGDLFLNARKGAGRESTAGSMPPAISPLRLTYTEIPLLIRAQFKPSWPVRPHLLGGMSVDILTRAEDVRSDNMLIEDAEEFFPKFDMGFIAGAGASWDLPGTNLSLALEGRFEQGIFTVGSFRNQTFSLLVGFELQLGTRAHTPPSPVDRDRDRIPDNQDKCPDEPEDYKGLLDGCPEKKPGPGKQDGHDGGSPGKGQPSASKDMQSENDRDKDGLSSARDRCPDEPARTWDGCPRKYDSIEFDDSRIGTADLVVTIKPPILLKKDFKPNSKASHFKAAGQAAMVLNDLARLMRDYPQIQLRIEGNRCGDKPKNSTLPEMRASDIRDRLLKRLGNDILGDKDRLTIGSSSGPDAADGAATEECRVDFVILQNANTARP